MTGIPLLQTVYFQTQTDWRTIAILGGIIVAVVLSLLFYGRNTGVFAKEKGSRRFGRRAFRREASSLGLTKFQIRLLESFVRTYQVRRPFNLLTDSRDLNITLAKALRDINHMEAGEAVVEGRKLEVYRIKQRIDRAASDHDQMPTTKQLRLGQNITFQQENGHRHTSVITANLKEFYCAQTPSELGGEPIKWRKGHKIKLFIWGLKGEEMVFESKVMGYTTVKRITSVMLNHTNRVFSALQRKYRRRPLKGSSAFFPIRIVEKGTGRKPTRQAVVVNSQGRVGSMIDISAGGCSLSTRTPFPRGELIKINVEPHRGHPLTAFGKIVDSRAESKTKVILHVMFTRASSKSMNRINEYVYNFD